MYWGFQSVFNKFGNFLWVEGLCSVAIYLFVVWVLVAVWIYVYMCLCIDFMKLPLV